jgi:rubrerythrin
MSTACGRASGTFRQIRQLADGRREHFDKFDSLRTAVENISTNSTACGRASGTFRQIRRLADERREHFDKFDGLRTAVGNISTVSKPEIKSEERK